MTTAAFGAEPAIEINKKYIGGSYTFTGTVERKIGTLASVLHFSGKTNADAFECDWVSSLAGGMKGSVKITANSGSLTMPGIGEQKFNDPMMAMASASGVSQGSVHLMYALWKGQKEAVLPSTNIVVSKTNDGLLISGESQVKGIKLSVTTTKDNYITSVKSVSNPSELPVVKLSVQEIKAALKALNKPESPEEIESVRNTMKLANDAITQSKEGIETMTTISVKWSN